MPLLHFSFRDYNKAHITWKIFSCTSITALEASQRSNKNLSCEVALFPIHNSVAETTEHGKTIPTPWNRPVKVVLILLFDRNLKQLRGLHYFKDDLKALLLLPSRLIKSQFSFKVYLNILQNFLVTLRDFFWNCCGTSSAVKVAANSLLTFLASIN